MNSKLTFSDHILAITKKAYTQSILLTRCFLSRNPILLKIAFASYVRPILEYASPVWSPRNTKDIIAIDNVQRRFTKSIPNLHSLPYSSRLKRLNLQSLSTRRSTADLCTVYRILHNLTPLVSSDFFSLRNTATRGHPFTLVKPPVRLDSCKFAFHSRVINLWNSLPLTIVLSHSLTSFKLKLKSLPPDFFTRS